LKEELEQLKTSKSIKAPLPQVETHKASVAHDIKNSYIQNLHMRSSMFYLWVISGILGYAHKIPFIGKLITLLSIWYGRTTIWKILIKVRKVFIAFNAAIGVYMVYKTVGFSTDNLFAAFAGMGHTYLEIFINSTKRLFHWFFELFDHKIVPNVPNTPPTSPPTWWPTQTPKTNQWIENYLNKPVNTDWFKSPFSININTSTPWYKDFSSWMWIAGILILVRLGTEIYLTGFGQVQS
jgi:hypothetical protein